MRIFDNPNYDFIRWRWHALALSRAGRAGRRRLHGRRAAACRSASTSPAAPSSSSKFEQPVAEDAVRQAARARSRREGRPAATATRPTTGARSGCPMPAHDEGASRSRQGARARLSRRSARPTCRQVRGPQSQEIVGPVIGRELQLKGIYATLASIAGIAVYIALPLPARPSPSAPSPPRCTTCSSRSCSWPSSATTCR